MANFHSQEWFDSHIESHFNQLQMLGYDVIAIFYYGSGNYGMDIESSDFDTIAFVAPKFSGMVALREPASTIVKCLDGEAKIRDIRYLPQIIKGQNYTDLQIFYSIAYKINVKYQNVFKGFFKWAEILSNWDTRRFLLAISSQSYKALRECEPIGTHRYRWKKASIIARVYDYVTKLEKDCYITADLFTEETEAWKLAYECKITEVTFDSNTFEDFRQMQKEIEIKVKDLIEFEGLEFNSQQLPAAFLEQIKEIVKIGMVE